MYIYCVFYSCQITLISGLQHLVHVYRELGYKPEDCVPFSILCQHPFIQGLVETSTQHQLIVSLCVQPSVCYSPLYTTLLCSVSNTY